MDFRGGEEGEEGKGKGRGREGEGEGEEGAIHKHQTRRPPSIRGVTHWVAERSVAQVHTHLHTDPEEASDEFVRLKDATLLQLQAGTHRPTTSYTNSLPPSLLPSQPMAPPLTAHDPSPHSP